MDEALLLSNLYRLFLVHVLTVSSTLALVYGLSWEAYIVMLSSVVWIPSR